MHYQFKIFCFIIACIFLSNTAISQDQILSDFNACDATNSTGVNGGLVGDINCDCGVEGSGLLLDGVDDYVEYREINGLDFADDFTLSFYFWVEATGSNIAMEIVSIRDTCVRDSSFSIKYFPATDELSMEFANADIDFLEVQTQINTDLCWHFLTIVKEDGVAVLWIDGEEAGAINVTNMNISQSAFLRFGQSPCTDLALEQKFTGKMDELKFFNRSFSNTEIRSLDLFPDRIITNDTTIFLGESLFLETGDICANDFEWSPGNSLSDVNDTNPNANPEVNTTYVINIDHGSCQTVDSVLVRVVNKDDLPCDKLILPNAFTPNDDNINDQFGISSTKIVDELVSFQVYNKWGALLFEANDDAQEWDGFYKGKVQNTDVYLYKINYRCAGAEYSSAGNFTLLR